ncbi:hypothetical protein D9M72_442300 [compost metagenome]
MWCFSSQPVSWPAASWVQSLPPVTNSGFLERDKAPARASASVALMPPAATGMAGCSAGSTCCRMMSSGRPTTTGPGRPLIAANMASATISDARSAWSSTMTRFAPVSNQALMSNSWNASRSRCAKGMSPTKSSMGVESCQAVWSPTWALAAPGPRVTMATPGRWFILPSASAMYAAPPSCRQATVSMSEPCSPSSTSRKLSPGTT